MSKNSGFIKMSSIKSWGHCKNYDKYLRGELEKQKEEGLIKTQSELYDGFNCNRDMFTETAMSYMRFYHPDKDFDRKVYCFTNTYHPLDKIENGGRLTPEMAHDISKKLMSDVVKDYPALAVTHIDKDHLHTQFIIGNVNIENGKSFQFSKNDMIKLKEKYAELLKENGLTHSLTTMKERPYKVSKNEKTIYPEKEKTPSIGELKVKKRSGFTNKEAIGSALKKEVEIATSFSDLKSRLYSKYEIKIEEKGKAHYVLSHPDSIDRNGKIRSFRETNLGKEYSMTREEIEKKIAENRERLEKEYNSLAGEEQQKMLERINLMNERDNTLREQIKIENDYDKTRDKALSNSADINKNEINYRRSRTATERQKLLQEREKLFDIQEKIKYEMRNLNKRFDELQEKIDGLTNKINKTYDDKDKRIISDTEYKNRLPLDSDLGKLPQKLNIELDNTRSEERVLSVNDMNGAEYINKGLQEQRRIKDGNRHDQISNGNGENGRGITRNEAERKHNFGPESTDRSLEGAVSGKTQSLSGAKNGNREDSRTIKNNENGNGELEIINQRNTLRI